MQQQNDLSSLGETTENLVENLTVELSDEQLKVFENMQAVQNEQMELIQQLQDAQILMSENQVANQGETELVNNEIVQQLSYLVDFLDNHYEQIAFAYKLLMFYGFVGVPLVLIVVFFWTVFREFLYTKI